MPVPMRVREILEEFCLQLFFSPQPRYIAEASPAKPAGIWMTFPPAKSMAPILKSHPSWFQFQKAIGAYTMILKAMVKMMRKGMRMRPITEPMKMAGVMAANMVWKKKKVVNGIVAEYSLVRVSARLRSPQQTQSPMKPVAEEAFPKASEKPTRAHVMEAMMNTSTQQAMVLSRFFLLTIPPQKKPTPGVINITRQPEAITQALSPVSTVDVIPFKINIRETAKLNIIGSLNNCCNLGLQDLWIVSKLARE